MSFLNPVILVDTSEGLRLMKSISGYSRAQIVVSRSTYSLAALYTVKYEIGSSAAKDDTLIISLLSCLSKLIDVVTLIRIYLCPPVQKQILYRINDETVQFY